MGVAAGVVRGVVMGRGESCEGSCCAEGAEGVLGGIQECEDFFKRVA